MSLSERAPSNQPTESIERMLDTVERDVVVYEWKLRDAYASVIRTEQMLESKVLLRDRLQKQLQLRRDDENEGL